MRRLLREGHGDAAIAERCSANALRPSGPPTASARPASSGRAARCIRSEADVWIRPAAISINAATSWPKPPRCSPPGSGRRCEVGATAGPGAVRRRRSRRRRSASGPGRRRPGCSAASMLERVALPAGCTLALECGDPRARAARRPCDRHRRRSQRHAPAASLAGPARRDRACRSCPATRRAGSIRRRSRPPGGRRRDWS